jgi:hypothetical protein
MVFWVALPCSTVIGNQHFGGCAASNIRVDMCGQDVSTALLPSHRGSMTSIFTATDTSNCIVKCSFETVNDI